MYIYIYIYIYIFGINNCAVEKDSHRNIMDTAIKKKKTTHCIIHF